MADIFLSYSRADLERARRVEQALETCGFTVFWDRELIPGGAFRLALARELEDADCVIVLWSHTSITSEWVIDEAEAGRRNGRLLSVIIDDVLPPLGLRQDQAAILTDWNGDCNHESFAMLVRGLKILVPAWTERGDTTAPSAVAPASFGAVPDALLSLRADPTNGGDLLPPARPGGVGPANEPVSNTEPRWWLAGRYPAIAPTALLAGVFLVNLAETSADRFLTPRTMGVDAGYPVADAFRWFERWISFEGHESAHPIAVIGYSLSYFVLFPAICLLVAVVLARRPEPKPYRAVSVAVGIDYLVSLPFFLFFPVPERWSSPETGAILLSDKLSGALIDAIRPISGLDNSFPSFHASLTAIVVTACVLFEVPLRTCVIAIGATVVLATFALGIHWIPDIVAGLALGVASMLLAYRLTRCRLSAC
jgi:membrane-associated phospholipid phosphatase